MPKRPKHIFAALAACAVLGLFTAAADKDFKIGQNIEILVNLFRDLNVFYVDDVDADKMMQDAAAGMVRSLDPYTEFLPAEKMTDFELMTTGKYGGIGSLIRQKGDWVYIAEPYKNSPADKAGLEIGDKILEINGVSAEGLGSPKVSSMMKGEPGSTLRLKVEKFYTLDIQTVTIRRERISIPAIPFYTMLPDSIGYIHHSDFTEGCSEQMRSAVNDLKKQGARGLVLDYRSNVGGILQEAVAIVSLFVPKGTEVVSIRGRQSDSNKTYYTETEPIDTLIPIAVLTDSYTASSAEIVAGALQDLDRAVLIGRRTFGKGLVQSTRPTGFNSYLKVTTAKYYIPSGRCIQAIDYTHRNPNGSVGYVADSLVSEFATRGGRKVYDGGGIMPDIRTEPQYASGFAISLYEQGAMEDFADTFMRENRDTEIDPLTFSLPEEWYLRFARQAAQAAQNYKSETETALDELASSAERELLLPEIKQYADSIRSKIAGDKDGYFQRHRDELSALLEDEILLRRTYAEGVAAHKLLSDKDTQEAERILNNPAEYRRILAEQDTERK